MANLTVSNVTFPASFLEASFQYIGFGLVDAIVNIFILFVLGTNKKILKKFAFVFGFAIADTISGLSLFINGLIRVLRLKNNTITNYVHPSICMPTTQFNIFGIELLAAMFFFVGVERSAAVGFFTWYYKKWTERISWYGILLATIFAIFSLGASYIIAFSRPAESKVTYECSITNVIGMTYTIYHCILGVLGGLMAFLPTLASLIIFYKRKQFMEKQKTSYSAAFRRSITKNFKVAKLLLSLAFLDLCMVAIPNIMLILYTFKVISISELVYWFTQLACLRGSMNLFIYFFTNDDFRAAVCRMIKRKNINAVTDIPVISQTVTHL